MAGNRIGGLKAAQKNLKTQQAILTSMQKLDEKVAQLLLQATEVVKDSLKISNATAT